MKIVYAQTIESVCADLSFSGDNYKYGFSLQKSKTFSIKSNYFINISRTTAKANPASTV